MADTPTSIQAALLIQLPGHEAVEVGALDIPLTYAQTADGSTTSLDHDAIEQTITSLLTNKVLGTGS